MKASNIILTTVFGGVTLLMLTAMVEFSVKSVPNGFNPDHADLRRNHVDLPVFHYVSVTDVGHDYRITVAEGDTPGLNIVSLDDMPTPYFIRNDTLYFTKIEGGQGTRCSFEVQVPRHTLQGVHLAHTDITLTNLQLQTLSADVVGGSLRFAGANGGQVFERLAIHASEDARIYFNDHLAIDTLAVDLTKAEVTLNSDRVDLLTGHMEDHAMLMVRHVRTFDFYNEASCRLRHFE